MPSISSFLGIIIKMFFTNHNPPHFHAYYQGDEAVFDIQTGEIIEGQFPKRQKNLSKNEQSVIKTSC